MPVWEVRECLQRRPDQRWTCHGLSCREPDAHCVAINLRGNLAVWQPNSTAMFGTSEVLPILSTKNPSTTAPVNRLSRASSVYFGSRLEMSTGAHPFFL